MGTPLVYATKRAQEDAKRLLPGRCLENAVGAEIAAGNVTAGSTGGFVFASDKAWIARTRRVPARVAARRAWLVIDVRPHHRERST